jgi:hypothetical protein
MLSKDFASTNATLKLGPHAFIHKINFEDIPKATTQAMRNAYTAAGLADMDGDDIYSDILPGSEVNLRIYYHFEIDNNLLNCEKPNHNRLFEGYLYSYVHWKDRCEQDWSYSLGKDAANSTFFRAICGGMLGPVADLDKKLLVQGDIATLTVMMQDGTAGTGQSGYPYEDIKGTRIHGVEVTLPKGLDYNSAGKLYIRNRTSSTRTAAANINWNSATGVLTFRNNVSLD